MRSRKLPSEAPISPRKRPARPAEPLPRYVEDPTAREIVAKLRAGVVLPSTIVADVIESFVLELEERDRVLGRVRNRLDIIAARFPSGPILLSRYLKSDP